MTLWRARPHYCLASALAQIAAITLVLGLSFTVTAQDNNPEDCSANKNDRPAACSSQAEITEATSFVPTLSFDWVPLEAVPESLRDRQCLLCEGRYIDPLANENKNSRPEKNEIRARADLSEVQEHEVVLTGDVTAVQGYRQTRSDQVVINRKDQTAIFTGDVTMREPGVLLLGDNAKIYSNTGEAVMYDAQFIFHEEHLRGTADVLERDQNDVLHIHNGTFTFCAPGENDWAVLSDSLVVDLDEGLATAYDATIEVEGVPVFYTPWLRLPLDDRRRTGFLWPDFGNDGNGGLDINVPIYFNLAPNYDALYGSRFIQERGLDQSLQLRYLNPYAGNWLVGGAYLKNDERYRNQIPANESADRWLGVIKQNGLFEERWRSRIDYNKASDVDYMIDLEAANIDAQRSTALLQMASVDYLGDNWLTTLRAQQFQSLANDIRVNYQELPQLNTVYRSAGTPFELQPIAVTQYSNFGSDEDIVTGQRLYGEAGMSYPMLWQFGSLVPTLKYRQVNYELSDSRTFENETPSAGSGLFNLDGGLVFERETSLNGQGLLQTLEPRLYYLYSEREDQTDQPVFDSADLTFNYYQLFRETRFSGHDRLDDANQISAGVGTRYIDETTGRDLLSASIGQIYYFEDRDVQLLRVSEPQTQSTSDIAAEFGYAPTRQLEFRTSLVWDPHEENMNASFVQGSYKMDNGSIFNLGYAYRRAFFQGLQPQTEEARASTYLPLDKNWSIFASINYSLEENLSVEDMIGVEYDTCCWTVRLLNLRLYNNVNGVLPDFNNPDLEQNQTIQFQILLKGMGGFGNRITNIMQTMIRGFEDHEY